ncbi:MAG: hypothetical protein IPG12_12200 [Saprospiraceae bacterium]|nr:hypothetical protein [Saprospiraceae bacterium]
MKFKKAILLDPFVKEKAKTAKAMKTIVSGSNDFYGANSLETFSSASGLTYTHDDADGFLDYPTSFPGKAANYWRKDAGVKVWAYEETYDNWQDSFGIDAVRVFYHSGHGDMDNNGVFKAPLGGLWDNRDWAFSNRMAFSNEELRYMFWSTCYSIRVSGSDNPVRSWWDPNRGGLRMMFGYETTSIDDPNYGKFFWDEWKKGKTFARAFLDASWRISHGQVPVVMAVGANANEAIHRLNNERLFSQAAVTKGWYQWQWIGTLPSRSFANRTAVPKKLNGIILTNKFEEDKRLASIGRAVGLTKVISETILFDAKGNRQVSGKDVLLNINDAGALNIYFGKPNLENKTLIAESKAIKIAQKFMNDLNLAKGIELKPGNIRYRLTNGGTLEGSGTLESPSVVETIVQYRQSHNGVESVNSDHGLITVSIDNDGKVINYYDSTKLVLGEVDIRTSKSSSPKDPKKAVVLNDDKQFKKKIDKISNSSETKSSVLKEFIGYDFSSNLGAVVHQKDVEIDFGRNLKKRYKLRVPLS